MALDDPNITKIIFTDYEEPTIVEVDHGKIARLACVMLTPELKPHVEIIDCAPGVYRIRCKKRDIPERKIWFDTQLVKSYLPRKKQGRYS